MFCDLTKVDPLETQFWHGIRHLRRSDTPESLGLGDGDVIDAVTTVVTNPIDSDVRRGRVGVAFGTGFQADVTSA